MIKIGSLFAGIGGFELGLERAFGDATTVWQVEQNTFCQTILAKHWPNATIHNDVREVGAHNLQPVDVICGGFPCQDISTAGKQRGIIKDETRSGLWWEMWRIISELRPRIAILENVPNIVAMGGSEVVGSLATLGYCVEWGIISAAQCGAPHQRRRWFCVAYTPEQPNPTRVIANANGHGMRTQNPIQTGRPPVNVHDTTGDVANTGCTFGKRDRRTLRTPAKFKNIKRNDGCKTYWQQSQPPQPTICTMDDGISGGVDRSQWRAMRRIEKEQLKALGNAIVHQCSQWIGQRIVQAGLLDDLIT